MAPVRLAGAKRLWIVPERVPFEDVAERVSSGAIVDGTCPTVEGWWAMLVQYPLDPFLYRTLR